MTDFPVFMITFTRSARRKAPLGFVQLISLTVAVTVLALLLPSCSLLNLAMLKLRFGCVPEGTRIDTASGAIQIEDLKTGDSITGFNGSQVRITQIHQYQEDPTTSHYLTVHFADGAAVSVSPRHRIDGTPAGKLKTGDRCGSQRVARIEILHGVSRSFDLLTEDPGYRISGIPVNSMIEEMLGR